MMMHDLARPSDLARPNDREVNLLWIGSLLNFWNGLRFDLWPFGWFMEESCRVAILQAHPIETAIC